MRQERRDNARIEVRETFNGAKNARIALAHVRFMISAPLLALDGH
jgi:hypothetical protein